MGGHLGASALLRRSLTIIVAYFVCWQFAANFTVATDASAFYPAAESLVFFIYRWGWRYLAAAVAAMFFANIPQNPFWDWSVSNYLHLLRQLLVYGGLALMARKSRWLHLPLETLDAAMRLIVFAGVSSLLSAGLAMGIFWACLPTLREFLGSIFLGFWIGDFSGVLIFLCIASVVMTLQRRSEGLQGEHSQLKMSPLLLRLGMSTCMVVGLMVFMESHRDLHAYSYLILLPVIFGTVAFGMTFGLAAAVLADLSAVVTYIILGTEQMPAIQMQLLCAVVMCVGIVLGGAMDDRKAARFDAAHDPLTGLLNRRAFFEQGEMMLERARRYQQGLAVVMLDLDHFKLVNDLYGHDAGDRLLCQVSEECKSIMRKGDLSARIGGEEFALLIENADATQTLHIAERLRDMIGRLHRGSSTDPVSASMGVSIFRGGDETLNDLLSSADRLLYVAKETGRNRVILDEHSLSAAT